MATAPTANDLTRQQLDELDALLQRMLTLPINPPEATPAPASTWRMDTPASRLPAPPLPVDPPRPRSPEPAMPAPEPTVPVVERKTASAPVFVPAPARTAPPAPRPAVSTSEPREPVPWMLWPLVAFSWVVDSILGLCGPPGWLLRSGFGKNLLGLAGIGLLGYTAAHIALEQGWMRLPFPLPWPR